MVHQRCRRIWLQRADRCLGGFELAYGAEAHEYADRGQSDRHDQSDRICNCERVLAMRDKPHRDTGEQKNYRRRDLVLHLRLRKQ